MILSWILNSLEADLANSVINVESVSEIWTDLHERFSQINALRIFQIKLMEFWDELASYNDLLSCTCGAIRAHAHGEQGEKGIGFTAV